MKQPQNLANHARYVPGYHYVLFGLLVANLLYALYSLRHFNGRSFFGLVVAVSLILIAWYEREFVLTVQNRVIRLEETLRIQRLCPDLAPRAAGLRAGQFVALRFASDAELPGLLKKVLDEDIRDLKEIKRQVREWRADHLRA